MPRMIPTMVPMTIAAKTSSSVAGNRSRMSFMTGRLVMNDVPRSPVSELARVDDVLLG